MSFRSPPSSTSLSTEQNTTDVLAQELGSLNRRGFEGVAPAYTHNHAPNHRHAGPDRRCPFLCTTTKCTRCRRLEHQLILDMLGQQRYQGRQARCLIQQEHQEDYIQRSWREYRGAECDRKAGGERVRKAILRKDIQSLRRRHEGDVSRYVYFILVL